MGKKSTIHIEVDLDENNVPENIEWDASDAGAKANCKAMFLGVWDKQNQESMSLNIWTKEMNTDEMKQFFHQTFVNMVESFERAVPNEQKMIQELFATCNYFAEEMELISPEEIEKMRREAGQGDDVDLKDLI